MLLNYDMTFLVVLLTGLYELEDKSTDFVCALHPTKKRTARINEATEYAADMNIILSYQNFEELRYFGFYLGKFVYLMDAYEDFETDKRKNAYNVFRVQRKEDMQNLDTFVKLLLTSMMSECAKSFERLPILMHADILRNVLYSGVWTKYEYNRLKRERKQQKLLEKQKAEKQKADRKSATK